MMLASVSASRKFPLPGATASRAKRSAALDAQEEMLARHCYDAASGTNYNYFRDYDPSIGRYVESDPIGLGGGLNTYGYVKGNPLIYVDDDGLAAGALPGWLARSIGGSASGAAAGEMSVAGALGGGAAVSASFLGGYALGSAIYPGIEPALSKGIDWCMSESEEEKKRKNCQALKDSILKTCYGLSPRKRMKCYEAANTSYRQCMGWE